MMRLSTAAMLIAIILLGTPAFAQEAAKPKEEVRVPKKLELPMSEEEYERKMRSANIFIYTGIALTAVGGLAAIGGSIYWAAKKNDRTGAAIITGSGAALGIAGGVLTAVGYHKRNTTEMRAYSVAPVIDPSRGLYALQLQTRF